MSSITTHVLDTSTGRPAAGVPITLSLREGDSWREHGRGATDANGRLRTLLSAGPLVLGSYRIVFDTGAYARSHTHQPFYPSVTVDFDVHEAGGHYHIPLLLSPYGYSTYRGS